MKEKFSREFLLKRESMGLSRDQLAKLLDVSATSIQNWEMPTHNSFPKAMRWGKIYEVMGIDCMMYRYGVPIGDTKAAPEITVDTSKEGKHEALLSDLELLLLTLLRSNGSNTIGESCLRNLLGAGKKL